MKAVYLISAKLLKQYTSINDNTENYLLNNCILDAQTINVQQATGTKLYNKIIDLVESGAIEDACNINYKTLLDNYIQPVVIQYAYMYCLPEVAFKVMNKGLQSQNSDNSNSVGLDELQYKEQGIRNKAEFYLNLLIDHLNEHKSDYPELLENCNGIQPSKSAFTCGLVLDGKSKGYYNQNKNYK